MSYEICDSCGTREREAAILAGDCRGCLRAEIKRLRTLVKDLADDLASELRGRYWSPDGTVHPAEQRRYERDMFNVYEARRALEIKP